MVRIVWKYLIKLNDVQHCISDSFGNIVEYIKYNSYNNSKSLFLWSTQNHNITNYLFWTGKKMKTILDFQTMKVKFSWDLLFLFGGGFSLAAGSQVRYNY